MASRDARRPASALRRWLQRCYVASRLPPVVDAAVDAAPPAVRRLLWGWLLQVRVRNGFRLVPERALEASYIRALALLIEQGGRDGLGDYLEFGVAYGGSMACMSRALDAVGATGSRLIGFDSFEGLPVGTEQEDAGVWKAGQFRVERRFAERFLREQGVDMTRVTLVEGWFADTLNDDTRRRLELSKASVVMVDCDLRSSARDALEFCAPLIRDRAVVVFDDWHAAGLAARNLGEKRAFQEFLDHHPEFEVERLSAGVFGSYTADAEIFLVSRRPGDGRRAQA